MADGKHHNNTSYSRMENNEAFVIRVDSVSNGSSRNTLQTFWARDTKFSAHFTFFQHKNIAHHSVKRQSLLKKSSANIRSVFVERKFTSQVFLYDRSLV